MRNTGLYFIIILLTGFSVKAFSQDTTIVVNNKQVVMQEDNDRLNVKVYDITEGGNEEKTLIFEGHYKDGKSYERRHLSFSIPAPFNRVNRVKFRPHWDGFAAGFTNFSDKNLKNINDIDGVTLQSGSSLEYNLNLFGHAIRLGKQARWAFVTGAGFRWTHYRFSEMWEGSDKSDDYLNIRSLTIPLLIEWQSREGIFLSGGIEGIAKVYSKGLTNPDKRLALRPVTMDFLLQMGFRDFGIYAKYSPVHLFEGGKGPEVYPVSIGLQLYFRNH